MMKKIIAFFLVVLTMCVPAGCKESVKDSEGYSFRDDLGRSVSVVEPKRVATLLGSYCDMWILAGGEVCATADDAWDDFNLSLPSDVKNIGSTHNPNKEVLFESSPDFVIASSKLAKHIEMKDILENAGITVAYFDVGDFQSYLRVFKIMTDITGRLDCYEEYGVKQEKIIDTIISDSTLKKKESVLTLRASAANIRVKNSDDTMLGGMLKDLGCINIADSDSMILKNLSVESILEKNPDKIFFIQTGDDMQAVKRAVEQMFEDNPLWYELEAVKNNQVYYMEKRLYNMKANGLFSKAYKELENILYE